MLNKKNMKKKIKIFKNKNNIKNQKKKKYTN